MGTNYFINCLKNAVKELSSKKYEEERVGLERASLNFIDLIDKNSKESIELLEKIKKFYDLKAIHEDEFQLRYEIELLLEKIK